MHIFFQTNLTATNFWKRLQVVLKSINQFSQRGVYRFRMHTIHSQMNIFMFMVYR